MSQKTLSLWIEHNSSNDEQLQKLLSQKDTEFISQKKFLSQEQQHVVNKDKDNNEDDTFDNDMDNHDIENDNEPSDEEIMN